MADSGPHIATSGEIDRDDDCDQCGGPMLYRIESSGGLTMFCEKFSCPLWLVEVERAE